MLGLYVFWMALYYWWVILLFILASIVLNRAFSGITDPITDEAKKATEELQGLRADLRTAELQRQADRQLWDQRKRDVDQYVNYALRNPEARLDLIEKEQVEDGDYTLERHMKFSRPAKTNPKMTDSWACYYCGAPEPEPKRVYPPKVPGPVDRTGLPF